MSLPEEEFVRFLCENYRCGLEDGENALGELQLESEQRSAFHAYEEILTKLIPQLKKAVGQAVEPGYDFSSLSEEEKRAQRDSWLSKCNYGLWFTDVAAFRKENYGQKRQELYRKLQEMCQKEERPYSGKLVDSFITLLFALNRFMGRAAEEKESTQTKEQEWTETSRAKTKALYVSSARDVTRTSMIVAYYYYYNAFHEQDGRERWKSFDEVFRSFSEGVNRYLERAYYQPLSGRNILDVLIVFSAYAYIHDLMF